MSRVSTSIQHDGAAYRRGMVLGLTMAEVMLLLVFCLLIAAAVIFKRDREIQRDLRASLAEQSSVVREAKAERDRAASESRRSKEEASRLRRLVPAEGRSAEEARKLDDEWRKLVAAEEKVRRMEAAGLSPDAVSSNADDFKALEPLIAGGASGADVAAAAARVAALDAALRSHPDLAVKDLAELVRLAQASLDTESGGYGEHDWPPIINLSEAKGYSFDVGRAGLSPEFEKRLKTSIANDVTGIIERYDATVVEVIGHTDEQAMAQRPSNLDANLVSVLAGKETVDRLLPGDNAGLGMARAVSVARLLRADPRFSKVTVLPLSGGQLILPGDGVTDGTAAADARERRRIEIRVRRPEAPATVPQ